MTEMIRQLRLARILMWHYWRTPRAAWREAGAALEGERKQRDWLAETIASNREHQRLMKAITYWHKMNPGKCCSAGKSV